MPINTLGTAKPTDYLVGRGEVYFAGTLLAGDTPAGYRFLGNAPGLSLASETEEAEHFSSIAGLRVKDASVVVSQDTSFTLTLDEISHDNLALFLTGETATPTNNATAGIANLARTVNKGFWYDIYDVATLPTTDGQTNRLYDAGVITVTGPGGTPSYVEGTDFSVDRIMGRVFIIPAGSIANGGSIEIDVAANAGGVATIDQVKALTKTVVEGALKFIGVNPNNSGKKREVQIHKCKLRANGEVALITETDFAQIPLLGSVERSTQADSDSNYITITDHANS